MKAQHTPGPWQFEPTSNDGCGYITSADDCTIVLTNSFTTAQDRQLVLAAPDLLAALIDVRRALELANFTGELVVADAAIAKATTVTPPAEDDNECPHCAGTGEGQFEGQSCGACRGRGY